MELRSQLSISTTPSINISSDVAKNFSRGGVLMVENLGVASFPDVPEDENHNIILDSAREQRRKGDIPGASQGGFVHHEAKLSPDSLGPRTQKICTSVSRVSAQYSHFDSSWVFIFLWKRCARVLSRP